MRAMAQAMPSWPLLASDRDHAPSSIAARLQGSLGAIMGAAPSASLRCESGAEAGSAAPLADRRPWPKHGRRSNCAKRRAA
jgi:hypothetical protein